MTEKIRLAMQACEADSAMGVSELRWLMTSDQEGFFRASVSLLCARSPSPGRQQLLGLLAASDRAVEYICNPDLLSQEQSIEIARLLDQVEPRLDTKLARLLPRPHATAPYPADIAPVERVLAMLDAVSSRARIVPALTNLLRHPNPRLRAKAALLIGRRVRNTHFAKERLRETNPRVRASVVESLWGDTGSSVRSFFWDAAKDTDNRVMGNALLGLYRLQDSNSAACISAMAVDLRPEFRATAAWVMGQTADSSFLPALEKLSRDLYALVRKNARTAIERLPAPASL